ncbi:MAG: GNAT family N-acetyltransferase [Candidatus Bathyarchaeota archaeon]|nr:GNAT family N-acetyltransferase [Candidatus Bathyarchaeota archaeon]
MTYPNEWVKVFTAINGATVNFRHQQAEDTEMLWQMFSTLSEASLSNLVPPFTRQRIEGWTSNIDPDVVLAFVAVIKKEHIPRIVGVTSLKFYLQEAFKHKADLGITVHDDYQNLGVGTALLNHILAVARKKKIIKICLNVNTENDRALHMYRKAGFKIEGTLRREMYYKGNYLDEHRMALFL